jgi:hypothetical protein
MLHFAARMEGHMDTGTAVHELRVIDRTAGWAMGELDRCLLVVWRAQPTPDAFRTRNRALLDMVDRHGGGCALVEVVEPTSAPPANDTRRVAMQVFKDLGPRLAAIGIVLEGTQVKQSVNRAILTTMMFFVKQLQPTKVYKSIAETVTWVRSRIDGPPDLEQRLARGLDELRRGIQS